MFAAEQKKRKLSRMKNRIWQSMGLSMANESAFPTPKLHNGEGLTKKEYVEIAAMQALIMSGWKQANLVVAEARHYGELMLNK